MKICVAKDHKMYIHVLYGTFFGLHIRIYKHGDGGRL
jgi:hypothetical protein